MLRFLDPPAAAKGRDRSRFAFAAPFKPAPSSAEPTFSGCSLILRPNLRLRDFDLGFGIKVDVALLRQEGTGGATLGAAAEKA